MNDFITLMDDGMLSPVSLTEDGMLSPWSVAGYVLGLVDLPTEVLLTYPLKTMEKSYKNFHVFKSLVMVTTDQILSACESPERVILQPYWEKNKMNFLRLQFTGYVDEVYDETGFVWMEVKCSDETKTTAMFPISTGFRFVFGSIFSRITTCLVWSDWYNIVCDTIDTSNTYKVLRGRST